jgi:hypothetical protein
MRMKQPHTEFSETIKISRTILFDSMDLGGRVIYTTSFSNMLKVVLLKITSRKTIPGATGICSASGSIYYNY